MINDKRGWINYILNRINTEKTHEQRKNGLIYAAFQSRGALFLVIQGRIAVS